MRFVVAYRSHRRFRRYRRRRKYFEIGTKPESVLYEHRLDGGQELAARRREPRVEHGEALRKRFEFGFRLFYAAELHADKSVGGGEHVGEPVVVAVLAYPEHYAFIRKIAHHTPFVSFGARNQRSVVPTLLPVVLSAHVHRIVPRFARLAKQFPKHLFVISHIVTSGLLCFCRTGIMRFNNLYRAEYSVCRASPVEP